MTYKVSTNEHLSFLKARVNDKRAVRNYVTSLDRIQTSAERTHCISVGHHYGKVTRGHVCYYCGGAK